MSLSTKCEDVGEELYFTPPVYMQRYLKTVNIIEEYGQNLFSKVVDIGCSKMGLFPYLRRIIGVKEIIMMDIDQQILEHSIHRVNPLPIDAVHKREEPLSVVVLCADAKYPHYITLGADVVTMIEFIEHLYVKDLSPVVRNVFGTIIPRLVIVSTPNYEFNRFFAPGLQEGNFRHYDHKFEWTTQEFQGWCRNILKNFPQYDVTFTGCGQIPKSNEVCSQFGIFRRKESLKSRFDLQTLPQANQIKDKPISSFISSLQDDKNYGFNVRNTPCKGCLSTRVCRIIHYVEYMFDGRTPDEKFADNVRASMERLRLWLKEYLNSWDPDKGDGQFSYHIYSTPPWLELIKEKQTLEEEMQASSLETSTSSCKDFVYSVSQEHQEVLPSFSKSSDTLKVLDLAQEVEELELNEEEEDWTGFFSSDSDDEYQAYSPNFRVHGATTSNSCGYAVTTSSSQPKTETIRLKFIAISNPDSLVEKYESAPIKNSFFYIDEEKMFLIPLPTFCTWAKLEEEDRVRDMLLSETEISLREINNRHFVVLSLMEEEEEDLEDLEDDPWEPADFEVSGQRRIRG